MLCGVDVVRVVKRIGKCLWLVAWLLGSLKIGYLCLCYQILEWTRTGLCFVQSLLVPVSWFLSSSYY